MDLLKGTFLVQTGHLTFFVMAIPPKKRQRTIVEQHRERESLETVFVRERENNRGAAMGDKIKIDIYVRVHIIVI